MSDREMQEKRNAKDQRLINFDQIKIAVASPDNILSWSYGEITKPETINYRTQKPERDGLFDERVFGPIKDWECYCGKYKKIRYKGVICDRCGVEVTRSSVRRDRMGHIDLVVPVVHVWYLRGGGGVLSTILDLSISEVEAVSYFASFVVLNVDENLRSSALQELQKEFEEAKKDKRIKENPLAMQKLEATFKASRNELTSLAPKKVLSEAIFNNISLKYGQIVKVGIGAEAILALLKQINLEKEITDLTKKLEDQIVVSNRKKILKRLKAFKDLKSANILPDWLVLTRVPVIPPDLRPMVQLDGGRFAASDLNDLYRRVLNRNNRLKKLIGAGAPEVICRNEKRMLQEAVDALIDNSARRGKVAVTGGQRKLRSLSDILRGKQGRFRQNLLGKRVDYSGRSVIVIGPDLKLDECGIPKVMALELFKTFVISKLISDGHVYNVKNATKMIENKEPVVWDILEDVTKAHPVMLNRAPTLHRLGIQAFKPILIEGKAIQIHPLVCQAFNADFDGDQMAVHVPLSDKAKFEASEIMLSAKNLLKPASGEPIVTPRFDMILGSYYITSLHKKDIVKAYSGKNEAIMAWQTGSLHIREQIKVKIDENVKESDSVVKEVPDGRLIETCVGRILFNNILPDEFGFLNVAIDAKKMKKIISSIFKELGVEVTSKLLDKVKALGFEYATISGLSIGMDDISIPEEKSGIVKSTEEKSDEYDSQLRRGLITQGEKSTKVIELWNQTKSRIEKSMVGGFPEDNPVYMYVKSGTRGSVAQLTQMAGMKGLVVNPAGEIIEIPIVSNYKEGLTVFEYFISSHGSRKGRSDTSLRTSDAGYLTRRLVDVAQDVIVAEIDCKTTEGLTVGKSDAEAQSETLAEAIEGRISLQEVKSGKKVLVKVGEEITKEIAEQIEKAGTESVKVRSVIGCQMEHGICQKCYGKDLGTGKLVGLGVAVGIIAAQAIGEPGTQLTMKTFHLGGVTGEDITSGLPRVEEIFEARRPKYEAPICEMDGVASVKKEKDRTFIEIVSDESMVETIEIPEGYNISVKNNDFVKAKKAIAVCQDKKAIRSSISGVAELSKEKVTIRSKDKMSVVYELSSSMSPLIKNGERVKKGHVLSEGHLNPSSILKLQSKEDTVKYIISETKAIYISQGQSINDKHLEVISRQMLSKFRVVDEGGSDLVPGQIVDKLEYEEENKKLKQAKKDPIIVELIVMGITRVSLKTDSFLSAASFQETTSVLINAAIKGSVDRLRGLKENVIIGKLIPAGTGYKKGK